MLQLARNERDATQIDSDHTSQLQSTSISCGCIQILRYDTRLQNPTYTHFKMTGAIKPLLPTYFRHPTIQKAIKSLRARTDIRLSVASVQAVKRCYE